MVMMTGSSVEESRSPALVMEIIRTVLLTAGGAGATLFKRRASVFGPKRIGPNQAGKRARTSTSKLIKPSPRITHPVRARLLRTWSYQEDRLVCIVTKNVLLIIICLRRYFCSRDPGLAMVVLDFVPDIAGAIFLHRERGDKARAIGSIADLIEIV